MTAADPIHASPMNWVAALEHVGRWTEKEYDALPEGLRAELHDGKLILTPAPASDHSIALTVLQLQFLKAIPDVTRVIREVDVRLSDGRRRRIPDLVIVRESYHGSPTPASNVLLAVEVVSPGGGDEWGQKVLDYAEGGIPGYLIVEGPKDGAFRASYHVLREGRYELVTKADAGSTFTISEPFEAAIDLGELAY